MDVRLILDPAASGGWNMAVDEALLETARRSASATLRFYAWSPATLSLGYFQPHDLRLAHAASRPLPVVRRASGGGAIVHDRELTYSFTVPQPDRFAAIEQLVVQFHQTLCAALHEWNLSARLCGPVEPDPQPPFLCFQRRARCDVLVGAHKICGSAQRRQHAATLIHGSVLLSRSTFAPELPGLQEMADRAGPWERTRQSLESAWVGQLAAAGTWQFHPGRLTPAENERAEQILRDRFTSAHWTQPAETRAGRPAQEIAALSAAPAPFSLYI